MNDWHVYILHCADDSFYTGIARDVAQRIACHESGKGAKYTRGRGPFRLVYQETHDSRSAALRREIEIKSLSRLEKENLIAIEPLSSRTPYQVRGMLT